MAMDLETGYTTTKKNYDLAVLYRGRREVGYTEEVYTDIRETGLTAYRAPESKVGAAYKVDVTTANGAFVFGSYNFYNWEDAAEYYSEITGKTNVRVGDVRVTSNNKFTEARISKV